MYFKKLDFKPIPNELKQEILEDFKESYKNPPPVSFDLYNKESGRVSIYPMSTPLQHKISALYQNTILDDYIFTFQVVEGGDYVAPHIDPDTHRKAGHYYILSTGLTPAKTVWYKQKNETPIDQAVGIDYENLTPVSELIAEEDNWYWFKLDEIHSVENLSGQRLMIYCLEKSEVYKYV